MTKKRGETYENLTETEKIELRNHLQEIKDKILSGLPRTALDNVDAGLVLIGSVIQSEVSTGEFSQSDSQDINHHDSRW